MQLVVIAHNIRSTHNVGSIFRTCEGFGVQTLYLTGHTPYPRLENDSRLPHLADKLHRQIHKTALGAEEMLAFAHESNIKTLLQRLRTEGYVIAGLEQSPASVTVSDFNPPARLALILGEEVDGVSFDIQNDCDMLIEIPMQGKKESFNVAVATGIALYGITTGVKTP